MTMPNQYLPNSIYLITRRTALGHFYSKPTPETVLIFSYVLALCVERYQMKVHGFVIMSNHVHIILTDKRGTLPFFLRDFFSLTAKFLNRKLRKVENVWSNSRPGVTRLITNQDVINKMIYIMANPVNAHIVKKHFRWPGTISNIHNLDNKPKNIIKPIRYFKERSKLRQNVKLEFQIPDSVTDKEEYKQSIISDLELREKEIVKEHLPRRFLGVEKAMKVSCFARPKRVLKRSRINPKIACCDLERRIHELEKLIIFRKKYRIIYKKWKNGQKNIGFPPGTFAMLYYHGANIDNKGKESFG